MAVGALAVGALRARLPANAASRETALLDDVVGAGRVVANKLEPHEVRFANEIVELRGGTLVGNTARGAPGIDATLDGLPISLKETEGGFVAVLRHASAAEASARRAGYSGVEVFIRAPNIDNADALSDFVRNGPLALIPNQGTVSAINILTAKGWYRIPGR